MPFAADRARPGSGSTGSAIPRSSSSSVSVRISTTASRGIARLSCRACGGDGHRNSSGELALAALVASAQEPERPQRGAHGALARHRRRHRPGLDRLCARRDGEVPRRRRLARGRRRGGRSSFTDELIAADKQLDVMGGSAGAILGLLRLYRDTESGDVLGRAIKVRRASAGATPARRRRAAGAGSDKAPARKRPIVNGMSHGAAGFAYALASLAAATGREEFARGRGGMHRV